MGKVGVWVGVRGRVRVRNSVKSSVLGIFEISLLIPLELHVGHTKFDDFCSSSKIVILSFGNGVSTGPTVLCATL